MIIKLFYVLPSFLFWYCYLSLVLFWFCWLVGFVYGTLVLLGSNPLFMVFFLIPMKKIFFNEGFFLDCTSLLQQQWRICFGFVQLWKSLKDFHICTTDVIIILLKISILFLHSNSNVIWCLGDLFNMLDQ